ncbi:unnamed protein product, partial [marine sediment metagenome]
GDDTLDATFCLGMTVVPLLSSIETFNLTNNGSNTLTLNATNVSGVDTINQVNSTSDLSITGLQELVDFGFKDISDISVDMSLVFAQSSTTSGSSDEITCTLENATVGTATVNTAASNGFETINFVSQGDTANRLTTLTKTTGNTLATAMFFGSQDLQVDALPNSILTYDASGMTGELTLGAGSTADSYAAFSTADLSSITGGSGNDTFIFGNTLDSNDAKWPTEFIDGSGGWDVVQASFDASLPTQVPCRNVEELRFNATDSI